LEFIKILLNAGINWGFEHVKILQVVTKSPQRQFDATDLNPPSFSSMMYMSLV
jgi:hypothetical protein